VQLVLRHSMAAKMLSLANPYITGWRPPDPYPQRLIWLLGLHLRAHNATPLKGEM